MTKGAPTPERPGTIQVGAILDSSLRLTFGQPRAFLRAAALPLLVSIAALAANLAARGGASSVDRTAIAVSTSLIHAVAVGLFAYSWQRFTLIGPPNGRPQFIPRPSAGLFHYVLGCAAIAGIWSVPTVFDALTGSPGQSGMSVVFIYGIVAALMTAISALVLYILVAIISTAVAEAFRRSVRRDEGTTILGAGGSA